MKLLIQYLKSVGEKVKDMFKPEPIKKVSFMFSENELYTDIKRKTLLYGDKIIEDLVFNDEGTRHIGEFEYTMNVFEFERNKRAKVIYQF